MKLIRASQIKGEKRADGRTVKKLLELAFDEPIDSMVIYLCEVPSGKFEKHYHSECQEIICFPNGGKITVNGETYQMESWDMVLLDVGDVHGYEGDECPDILHLAIKLPNRDDKITVKSSR